MVVILCPSWFLLLPTMKAIVPPSNVGTGRSAGLGTPGSRPL
jgi:hypothetical protein